MSAEGTVVIMSGNFTQRGEPAIADKWVRAEAALRQGVDLVLELPFACATSSAEGFASGAIGILHHSGIVTHLSFGTEVDDIRLLETLSSTLMSEPQEFKDILKEGTASGL
jgi:predicted nucleotidyltransferase